MKKKAGFIINEIHREAWEGLSNEKCGQLIKILIAYQFDSILQHTDDPEINMSLKFLLPVVKKQKEDYEEKCEKNSEASRKRWEEEHRKSEVQSKNDANGDRKY